MKLKMKFMVAFALLFLCSVGVMAAFDVLNPYPSAGTAGQGVARGDVVRVLESRCVHVDSSTAVDTFVNKGDAVYVSAGVIGWALTDAASATDYVTVDRFGIQNYACTPASSIAYGARIYINSSTGVLNETAAGGLLFGYSMSADTITVKTVIPILLAPNGSVTGSGTSETVATTGTLAVDVPTLFNTAATPVVSLGSGTYVGQFKLITCSVAGATGVVSVTLHATSDPELFQFDAVDEAILLIWTGTEWATVLNVGTVGTS